MVTQYQARFGRRCNSAGAPGGIIHWILAAAFLLPTAACTVGPDFTAPVAQLADKFRGVNNRSVRSGTLEYQKWWEGFRDPTLNRLIEIAYTQNLTLLSAGTRVLQARAVLGIAIGITYPQVQQGTGSVIYNRTSAATPLSGPNATPSYFWTDALAAQAAWELDFWGKFRRGVESADAVYLGSIASYDGVLVSLLGDVTATYIGIRTIEQLIAIARDNVRRQEQALSIAKAKFQGGGTSELDVFQATNVLEQTRAAIPQLTIQLQQGENALCVLLGVPPQSLGMLLSRSAGRIPSPPRTIVVGIPADLLRRRPDVRAAELAALAQSAQIGVALTQLYPAISITGTFGGTASTANGHTLSEVVNWKGVAYAAGPSFQWNLLNYGQITNNVRLQDAKLQQLLVDYQNTVLSAQQEVDNGLVTYLQSLNQAAFLRRSVQAANGALRIAMEQYEQGATSFTTVLTAEQNLLQAQNSLAGASASVPLGLTAVFRALGGGWQIRVDGNFVTAATLKQMRARTDWGNLLPPANEPQPLAPGLPGPEDIGPTVRPPEW
ncbi:MULTISPECIES: efflux transporter outer membrane subunit [Bradyrhizobium]|uniref:efflux transporter outer membrane subunit n=1 Tax=Bradyrhizobium TaxID=374 RepID=UPI001FCCC8C0|nr:MULTISPECIES: efflux transporter outer membrane subunit [Bradyrhizobium]